MSSGSNDMASRKGLQSRRSSEKPIPFLVYGVVISLVLMALIVFLQPFRKYSPDPEIFDRQGTAPALSMTPGAVPAVVTQVSTVEQFLATEPSLRPQVSVQASYEAVRTSTPVLPTPIVYETVSVAEGHLTATPELTATASETAEKPEIQNTLIPGLPELAGSIVFDSTRDRPQTEIYIMNADGSRVRRLTANTSTNREPDLSPDGLWIAYQTGTSGSHTVRIMRVDGSENRPLFAGAQPAWSPDGRYLAYEDNQYESDIYIYDLETGTSRRLTNDRFRNRVPDWSPDGNFIVYASLRAGLFQIVVINVETGEKSQLTNSKNLHANYPAWSPDGYWIAYNTGDGSWPFDIWIVSRDGLESQHITDGGNNGRVTWSPDSQFVVYNSYQSEDRKWYLFRCRLDGSDIVQLTFVGDDQRANWGR